MLPLTVVAFAALGAPLHADDFLPADRPIEQVIDHYVDAKIAESGISAAPAADDAILLRRTLLDLAGRIPSAAETRAYLASTDPAKRVQLVDRTIASPGFVRHQIDEFDTMLMSGIRGGSLREYLTKAVGENRPWDRIFRELLMADESDAKTKGSSQFVRQRVKDLDKLTNEVSVAFFGVNVSCAQCHDHPKVDDWKQDHFFGMKSFFSRTFDNEGFLAEREYGQVKFRTTAGKEKQAKLMFLTGAVVEDKSKEPTADEQKKERELFDKMKKEKKAPPAPKFSARAKLVELALQTGQRDFFARAIINRLWHRFYGFGLVMPLDQMHSANPPSHPELLQWLARDLIGHGYDLRRLIRGIVMSKAYARSSRWENGDPPRASLFAVAAVRPLTPLQLSSSLAFATVDPKSLPSDVHAKDFESRLEALANAGRGLAGSFEQPGEDFQIGVGEALLFSNSKRIEQELLRSDRLPGRLQQTKDLNEMIDVAVRNVLCRPPTDAERQLLSGYLTKRQDRQVAACQQLVWALLTSAEFRFNY
jgi:hypothetical protein